MSRSDQSALAESDLKRQLHAKDQLVRALTDRLEEAAEQLDRVQRTGGDKGGRGGNSSDAALSGHPLVEKISRSLELWEDVQPADAFARIEERLEELRDMLQGAIVGTPGEAQAPKKKDVLSGWEKMKAELMGESAPAAPAAGGTKSHEASPAAKQQAPSTSADGSAQEQSTPSPPPRPVPVEPPRPLDELQLPEPVDLEGASRPDLVDAIEVRDLYIGELTRRLRSAESRTHQSIDWAALNNAPGDLREVLRTLESELTDRLRIAEVDLSLERARLSRVETRIRATQIQIEKKLQQSVGTDAGNGKTSSGKKTDAPGKSWFGGRAR
jgi:hypothetical protein